MITKVVVHEPGGFEKWLRNAASLLSPAFTAAQVQDAQALLNRVKNGDRPIDAFVRENLSGAASTGLEGWAAGSTIPDELSAAVLESLNEIMKTEPAIYTEDRFAGVDLSEETMELVQKEGLAGEDLLFANRFLLAEAYPDALQKKLDFVSIGKQLYGGKGGCKQCHSVDGSAGTGPSFQGIFGERQKLRDGSTVTVDEEYLRESIVNPKAKVVEGYQAVMPSYDGRLKPREIDALIEYIKSLGNE
jgi:mono/diheme cytochrome c family protein